MSSYVNPTLADLALHSAFPVRFPLMLNYRSGLSKPTRIISRDLTLQAVGKSGRAVAGLKLHRQPIRTAASPLAAPHRRKHFAAAVPYPSAC